MPLYFTELDEFEGRNDFLGTTTHEGKHLRSFGINPGGYVGFFDPQLQEMDTVSLPGDQRAAERLEVKQRAAEARRAIRYQRFTNRLAGATD